MKLNTLDKIIEALEKENNQVPVMDSEVAGSATKTLEKMLELSK